ncbi:hybrid sensor histidine kinase/response regulator [Megalodesulfovibrio gigas]|uniref:histidine kinase n=1 Tax=Megalodesulfovibrio gigas (strain ATCC 19364 / DSM 1382 / NCIMB 9332 / VKM B-1759) TaxID=1121448 RepID=T2G807_MEGG1|nr:hybrid sensor histidine kinase/response regulator [Megalodesulfovibrio gigas]AGW12710.1 putative two-component hybrid sensor and regulator [Megalodesulfovibrio gigas DSM 1382 = ATCC 19364]
MHAQPRQTILIVDDVETNLDTLVETLGDEYDVSVVMDGPSALQFVQSQPPDLILLDILMPDMDGYEVCRLLKADPATADIPIIFLTALTELEDKISGFTLGAVDYITKPFEFLEVKARVGTHLKLKQALERLERQNLELQAAARLHEDMERITHHDLKGPLNAILSFPEVIRESGYLNEEQRDFLRAIEQSGVRMLDIINLSLSLYKMEMGTYELKPDALDLLRALRKVARELNSLCEAKNIHLECLLEGRLVGPRDELYVMGDSLLCSSMLSNLLKNAIEHSPVGATVQVALHRSRVCEVRICNQGETSPEIRERFFEKYVTYGKAGGTGLGTYSARLLARAMCGDLELDASVPGETTVVARLPLPAVTAP